MLEKLQRFKEKVREIVLLDNVRCLLQWDQQTYMPPKAGSERGLQVALLSKLIHQQVTATEYGELLEEVLAVKDTFSLHDQRWLALKKRSYDMAVKLPGELVEQLAKTTSLAQQAWAKAKTDNDFGLFQPYLAEVIELNKQKAKVLDPSRDAYEVLLDVFEQGLTTRTMDAIFEQINPVIRQITAKYAAIQKPSLSVEIFAIPKQREFSRFLLQSIGYDFEQGSLDEVMHPFMIRLGKHDVRVTNRYLEDSLTALFSALHEGGHALFEQGFSSDYSDLLGDEERSLGVHESQSRFWENILGRSLGFWSRNYPKLQEIFGLSDSLEVFLSHINHVQPSLIRTESDEVTYNLHIQIRYELEKMLMSGSLAVQDVPQAWNQKYQDYLGITPPSDTLGCLQDVHWSHGSVGYFPTYTLGNVLAGQFWAAYKKFDADYQQTIATGDYAKILAWFRSHIHEFGFLTSTEELVQTVTGEALDAKHFVTYLTEKYL